MCEIINTLLPVCHATCHFHSKLQEGTLGRPVLIFSTLRLILQCDFYVFSSLLCISWLV